MTLNGLRNIIRGFFVNHAKVNNYLYGSVDDYLAIRDKDYFSVNVEFQDASVNGKLIDYTFNITIADVMVLGYPDTEHNAVSSSILIGNDFIDWLATKQYTTSGLNMQPFRETDGDICAGVVLSITFTFPISFSGCDVPEKSNPDVILDNRGNIIENSDNDLIVG